MKGDKLRIISTSDIHLGHRTIKANSMIMMLITMLRGLKDPLSIDMLYICGDFFDSGLVLSDDDVPQIQVFIRWIINFCFKYNIVIRKVEGTPSHDRKQSIQFSVINDSRHEDHRVDLLYVNDIDIVHEDKFGIDILYVPDEIRDTCTQTYMDVLNLMKSKGLEKVDVAIMHGNFKYQIPAIQHLDAHVEKNYLSIVKYFIFIGHVHTMSRYDRILANGSPSRFRHGEEEDKGFLDVTICKAGDHKINFIVNRNDTIFKTFNLTGKSYDDAFKIVCDFITDKPHGSHFKLKTNRDEVFTKMFRELKKDLPFFNWVQERIKPDEDQQKVDRVKKLVPVVLNENTLPKLIENQLRVNGCTDVNVAECLKILNSHG